MSKRSDWDKGGAGERGERGKRGGGGARRRRGGGEWRGTEKENLLTGERDLKVAIGESQRDGLREDPWRMENQILQEWQN